MLDENFVTNREWHTREADRGVGTYVIGAVSDYRVGMIR